MSTHKSINKICCVAVILAMVITVLFMNGDLFSIVEASKVKGYEARLFDAGMVHTIDIVIEDWDGFLETCTNEEYELCSVVIDNETYKNVAIRAKGNTSLTQVKNYENNRYSFKIEFDHYDNTKSYYGLDKLSLNNIIQDNTYMKDFLTYQMMGYFGADAPLCSFVYITVNGEDWGLYLAVESVEEAFLERNYGSDYGELYKPDSMSMGGGRGNGGDFDMQKWSPDDVEETDEIDETSDRQEQKMNGNNGISEDGTQMRGKGMRGGGRSMNDMSATQAAIGVPESNGIQMSGVMGAAPGNDGMQVSGVTGAALRNDGMKTFGKDGGKGGMGGSRGSSDVSLIYSDDEYDSYQNIFDNAKTDITDADKDRLIRAIKQVNACENIEDAVNIDEVIRYFVVHNFVCNFDSYTGSMIHNYYLYEKEGQLSMIPWDYNLAFGSFQGAQDASSMVNYPIDTPVSGGTVDSRPMLAWIFSNAEYTKLYHQYFAEFLASCFDSGYFTEMIEETQELIAPYVEKDPTKFCTYEEFEAGAETLKEFCLLRAESVKGQLEGSIASTSEGQTQNPEALVDASEINMSTMGNMNGNHGMGGKMTQSGNIENTAPEGGTQENGGGRMPQMPGGQDSNSNNQSGEAPQMPENGMSEDGQMTAPPEMSGNGQMGGAPPEMSGNGQMGGTPPEMSGNGQMGGTPPDMQGNGEMGERPDAMQGEARTGSVAIANGKSADSWILLGVCVAVLITGIAVAFVYKKRS